MNRFTYVAFLNTVDHFPFYSPYTIHEVAADVYFSHDAAATITLVMEWNITRQCGKKSTQQERVS